MRKIIPYHPYLVVLANKLRNNMTYAEIALWREIKNKKLGVRFSRQIPIDRYIVDFYCKDLRLAVEVDGSVHFEEGRQKNDLKRQTRLESLGVCVIRFTNPDVKNNLSWVLDEIRKEIEVLGPTPRLLIDEVFKRKGPTPDPSQEGNTRE
ncbi:MAG: endonuclease domain-containing protein [Muriicola sp.]|nr:endonuclease domain-containing protein [Muriicola sp.]NNK35496.1 endonuclease domain-containing protein [Eudoraea sp.]